ncbi:FG-GAP repeat-containing protein [Tanacetum coccineum]
MAATYGSNNSVYFNEGSSDYAYLAAGFVLQVAEKVAKGELDSAFAIVRPPSHHAEEYKPMGFCLFNNFAIATQFLLDHKNIEACPSNESPLIPQQNYKLDVYTLNRRQPGEFECREFRESVLGVMPHQWAPQKEVVKKKPAKSSSFPFYKPDENHPPGKDSSKKISNLIGKAANFANSAKTKKLWWVPNVVVAHGNEGIKVLHLAFGHTLCKGLQHDYWSIALGVTAKGKVPNFYVDDYITTSTSKHPMYMPYTTGRYHEKRFRKA